MHRLLVFTFCLIFYSGAVAENNNRLKDVKDLRIEYFTLEDNLGFDFPFSDATIVDDVIYVSGQIGNPLGKNELVPGGVRQETRQAMENIETILLALGSSMDKVFKCTCMLSDMADWSEMSEEYIRFFEQDRKPSRSAFAGSGLALGARVEIECWAIR